GAEHEQGVELRARRGPIRGHGCSSRSVRARRAGRRDAGLRRAPARQRACDQQRQARERRARGLDQAEPRDRRGADQVRRGGQRARLRSAGRSSRGRPRPRLGPVLRGADRRPLGRGARERPRVVRDRAPARGRGHPERRLTAWRILKRRGGFAGLSTIAFVYGIPPLGLPGGLLRPLAIVALIGFGLALVVPAVAARVEAWLSGLTARYAARTGGSERPRDGFVSGALVGVSLGFVYAPCAGPILAGVITVSAAQTFTAGRLATALA